MSMIKSGTLLAFVCLYNVVFAQENEAFELHISDDTILMGNYFEIQYQASNLQGEFDLPDFDDFVVVSGPNQSRNMSISNGKQQSSSSISFLLKPKSIDVLSIPPAYYVTSDKTWEVAPRDITVLPNPDGIVTESRLQKEDAFHLFQDWGTSKKPIQKKKKKLKETKI